VVGDVRFAGNGEWAVGRPLYVQYQGIEGSGLDEWKRAGKAVVLWPPNLKSGKFLYPYDPHPK
jgi:branched-chain amino acid transport system substrate-binding protein